MYKLTINDLRYWQPCGPLPEDSGYLIMGNRLLKNISTNHLIAQFPNQIRKLVVMIMLGYFRDVVADLGLWRAFTSFCKRNYGQYVPFFKDSDEYIESELNMTDVKFMVWYTLTILSYRPPLSIISPHSTEVEEIAKLFYHEFDRSYETAPSSPQYNTITDIELDNPEDMNQILETTEWLFWHSYLLTPLFNKFNAAQLSRINDLEQSGEPTKISEAEQERLRMIISSVTGPLAMNVRDWLKLLLNNDYQPAEENDIDNEKKNHPYYEAFINATGGKEIHFISNYSELNNFFITAMGWEAGQQHLPDLENRNNFVLYVTPKKGLLIAPDIAECIAHSDNPLYSKELADDKALSLLTEKGVCPPDLRKYIISNRLLPDAHFFNDSDYALVAENADFISRCYLQEFYNGD